MKNSQLRHLANLAGVHFTESPIVYESVAQPGKKKEFHQASLKHAIKLIKQAESDVGAVFRGTDVGDDYKERFRELLNELDADLDDLKNRED